MLGVSTADAARYLYSVDQASILSVIDTANPSVLDRIALGSLGSSGGPDAMAVHPAGNVVYVATRDYIAVVDAPSRTVVTTIPVADAYRILMKPNGAALYAVASMPDQTGIIFVIDTRTNLVTATIQLPHLSFVVGMAILPAGNKIYVAYNGRGASPDSVLAINTATNKIIATIPGAGSLFVDPAAASVYGIFGAHLSIIDTATDVIKATVTIPSSEPGPPDGTVLDVAFDPSGAWVYVGASDYCSCFDGVNGRVVVIEASKYSIVSTISLTVIPKALAITPSGSQIYAGGDVPAYCSRPSCVRPGGVAVIDTATRSVLATISPISDAPFQTRRGTVQVNPNDTSVYSSDSSSVYVIDTKANAIVASLPPSVGFIFKPDVNPPVLGSLRQYTVQSGNSTVASVPWGAPGDIPVPADYDGDGKTDVAVFRPREGKEEAIWYIIRSSDGVYIRQQWGSVSLGDVPVPADYDGDGHADIAVWRPFEGGWYIRRSSDGQTTSVRFARNTDLPRPADFDGDGVTDLAAYSGGVWMIFGSTIGLSYSEFGTALDIPVPADFDGDGRVDLAVWNPANGIWSVLNSSNLTVTAKQWGAPGDIPVPRDFDGDHKADFAIWRPSNGTWFVINSGNGSVTSLAWGASGDLPAPGDYDGDKRADPSVYRP
jgi:DNA-binding beta-propeller fold protein YncE